MNPAPHRGVETGDPRNAGIIAHFRPPEMTREHLRARFARMRPAESAEAVEARVEAFLADIAARPMAPPPPVSQGLDQVADRRYGLSTHPDLVERLWRLDGGLPQSCRWVVWGYPALVHPRTGMIFALAFGTIGLVARLPADRREEASTHPRPRENAHDIAPAGPEWRFLAGEGEEDLIRAAYDFAAAP
jgi:hypothetical protein